MVIIESPLQSFPIIPCRLPQGAEGEGGEPGDCSEHGQHLRQTAQALLRDERRPDQLAGCSRASSERVIRKEIFPLKRITDRMSCNLFQWLNRAERLQRV